MKPLRGRLQEIRERTGTPWQVLERDYVLSWVLAGISRTPSLRETLVFKGGTALKKCYFGDYRFSEDLDFTAQGGVPTAEAMERALGEACRHATRLLDDYAPVDFALSRYTERDPHPGAQEAFAIRARLPWQRTELTRVMVEITVDEPLLWPAPRRMIIHGYDETLDAQVRVYSLEEIVAEKLRAILQHAHTLEQRGWSRSRARDYYDLWRVLGSYRREMGFERFPELLRAKCERRGVVFRSSSDFLQERVLAEVQRTWRQWLGPLVPGLPEYALVVSELRAYLESLPLAD